MDDDDNDDNTAWNNLVVWLESMDPDIRDSLLVHSKRVPGWRNKCRGLFATRSVPPSTPLFTVPRCAHMNIKTLTPLYGMYKDLDLTATQLISMHLLLNHPQGKENSPDPNFGPYISILPKNFDNHPLSWLISSSYGDSKDVAFLIDCSPPATKRALNAMATRFEEDWRAVLRFLEAHLQITASKNQMCGPFPSISFKEHYQTYLWAWLSVNTRCVYHNIHPSASHPDNLTLCPLLDLANHASLSRYASSANPIPTFFSPLNHTLLEGDEVYLRYGSHSNTTLFTEYGFVEKDSSNGKQADIQDILESLFQRKGELGGWMKSVLEATKYWGDWTLHDAPAPAHPSYRILPALRLLQLSLPASWDVTYKDSNSEPPELQAWHDTILGEKDTISPENEHAVWQQLLEVCNISATRADEGLTRLQQECQGKDLGGWKKYAVEAISILWLEEKNVATAVVQSIKNGETIN
ncbi:SET domain-containing protein [Ramaria rubella]|nr:SET domain-containing protein [Ramaria rubella]